MVHERFKLLHPLIDASARKNLTPARHHNAHSSRNLPHHCLPHPSPQKKRPSSQLSSSVEEEEKNEPRRVEQRTREAI